MRFEFIPQESLPRLAWCAHQRRGVDVVEVRHGPWVETAEDWFVEGAWTGPFGDGEVVGARHLVGTAGRAHADHVAFCAPTTPRDRLQSARVGNDLYVSNSLVFLLRVIDDEPDPRYPYYAADRLGQLQAGIRGRGKQLRTARGRHILFHDHCDLIVRLDSSLHRVEKPATAPPRDYADYVHQLEGTIGAIQANAADPARRRRRYRPLATVSAGYDSPALAALMRGHGAREAITFTRFADDDGTAIGERLGYVVTRYDPLGFRRMRGAPEAEFHAAPPGTDVVMAVCEDQLVGTLLVTGRRPSLFRTTGPARRDLRHLTLGILGGTSMGEFRLRVGFLDFPPYYVGGLHPEAMHAISISPEMKPWSVGGDYDRPILRRIIEEAGIPRDWFGRQKRGSAYYFMRKPEDMSADGAADFAAYLRTLPPISRRIRATWRALSLLQRLRVDGLHRRVTGLLALPAPRRPLFAPVRLSEPEMAFAFHWGCARLRSRYDDGTASA